MGENDLHFQSDCQYLSVAGQCEHSPRGWCYGRAVLVFSSVCFPTTNFTEVFSIDNGFFVAGRWFAL
jgi:hypothetical protein